MGNARRWGTLDPFVEPGPVMGRTVANAGFLRALLQADPFAAYDFFLADQAQRDTLARTLEHWSVAPWHAGHCHLLSRLDLPAALRQGDFHCFHLSDCLTSPAQLAALRNALAPRIFPVTGVTHSLSYGRYAKDLLSLLWPGCTARDAVVATSGTAVSVLRAYFKVLREGYGLDARHWPEPGVVRIPLGIPCREFTPPDPAVRTAARQRLGARPEQCVLLIFGRLSHYAKLDALPVLRAVQRLAHEGLGPAGFFLILAGGEPPQEQEHNDYIATLLELARNLGLDARVVANPDDATRRDLYAAADVFLSPADNPQETFGLTLLEAGAMGLPVVASDYDGYRDIVVHEGTGLLVPTLGPTETRDVDLLAGLWFDNQCHLRLAQQTVVEVGLLAEALGRLARDPALRERLGQAGRRRVLERFDWSVVVAHYLELWERLWRAPVAAGPLRRQRHPLRIPYGRVFAAYPTRRLAPSLRVVASRTGQAVYRGQEFFTIYAGIADMVDAELVRRLLFMTRRPVSVAELTRRLRQRSRITASAVRACLLWALKHDLLEVVDGVTPAGGVIPDADTEAGPATS